LPRCTWSIVAYLIVSQIYHRFVLSVVDLEGAEPAPPPPLWATDWSRHSRYSWCDNGTVSWRHHRHVS